jgi:predicted nuclease of predicted toxin-antitoxin system
LKRILLDQGLAPQAAALLREAGWTAIHVAEVNLDRSSDGEILEYARQHAMICITLDHDFHTHLALAMAKSPSVILLRIEGLKVQQQVETIQAIWNSCEQALMRGAVVSSDGTTIRLRYLPLA